MSPLVVIGAVALLLWWLTGKKGETTKAVHGDVSIGDDFVVKASDPKAQAGNDYYTSTPQPTGADTP